MLTRLNWKFICICIVLGIVAEYSLFRVQVGISYSLFIAFFYGVFLYLFRKGRFYFTNIHVLLLMAIWTLSMMYFVYANPVFNTLNKWLIPFLIIAQTVLLTNSAEIRWYRLSFLALLTQKIVQTLKCARMTTAYSKRYLKRTLNQSVYETGKKIGIGILISVPLLVVISILLSTADQQFANLLSTIPNTLLSFQLDFIWRCVVIFILSMFFYCYFLVMKKRTVVKDLNQHVQRNRWDNVIIITVLIFINLVYFIFAIVQFQYFFSGTVAEGLSYAEYARRGFFELIIVTIINYVVLMSTLTFVKNSQSRVLQILLTLLIAFTGLLLTSAFIRLMLYEQAYGFTYSRVFAHAFMIYLFTIFAFTLMRVWAYRLSLARFYMIVTILFYIGLNVVGTDRIIVTNNIERFETTGKIDLQYLNRLSYSVVPPLVDLYQENPNIDGLKQMLIEKRKQLAQEPTSWQSFNLSRERAIQR